MAARTQLGKKHFMKTVHDELAKFEQKEIEFQKTERNQRAARLRLPIGKHYLLCPNPRQTVVQARSDPQGIRNLR